MSKNNLIWIAVVFVLVCIGIHFYRIRIIKSKECQNDYDLSSYTPGNQTLKEDNNQFRFKEQLINMVSEGQLGLALKKLLSYKNQLSKNIDLFDSIIILNFRFEQLSSDKLDGVLSLREFHLSQNTLTKDTLSLLHKI